MRKYENLKGKFIVGTWPTGQVIDYLFPRLEQINFQDIVWALSGLPRYSNMTPKSYYIAQHSLYVSFNTRFLCKELNEESRYFLSYAGLLHDASEAYLNDIMTPLKRLLPHYHLIEAAFTALIYYKAGIPYTKVPTVVKEADLITLGAEIDSFGLQEKHLPEVWAPVQDYLGNSTQEIIPHEQHIVRHEFGGTLAAYQNDVFKSANLMPEEDLYKFVDSILDPLREYALQQ